MSSTRCPSPSCLYTFAATRHGSRTCPACGVLIPAVANACATQDLSPEPPPYRGEPPATIDLPPVGPGLDSTTDDPTATAGESAAAPPVPATIGRFRVRARLGAGAFGEVYRAHDPQLDREVALKVAKPGALDSPERVGRFLREARAAANLRHPHIVPVHDSGDDGERHYIASGFVDGRTLEAEIEQAGGRPPDLRRAAEVVKKLAEALGYAHRQGVVHRDVKPANVLVDKAGEPSLTDFGLAVRAGDEAVKTQDGAVMGTPAYMSPEQAGGRTAEAGAASDQYALGVVLYEMATGRRPFDGPVHAVISQQIGAEPRRPRSVNSAVPRDLETVILKCLEKAPGNRYPSCEALADDLRRFLAGEPVAARRVGPAERLARWAKRNPAVAALSTVTALALLALAAGGVQYAYAIGEAKAGVAQEEGRRKLADERQERAEEVARLGEYHALFTRAREAAAQQQLGWTWQALADLKAAAALPLPPGARDAAGLRTAVASCLAGTDAREAGTLAPRFAPWAVAFHPNGRWAVLAQSLAETNFSLGSMTVLVVDFRSGDVVRTLNYPKFTNSFLDPKPEQTRSMALSPDGRWLVVGTRSGRLHRWDLNDPRAAAATWQDDLAGGECEWLEFSADVQSLYSGSVASSKRGRVSRWHVGRWSREAAFDHDGPLFGMAVGAAGGWVAVSTPNTVRVLNADTLAEDWVISPPGPSAMAAAPDGASLAFANGEGISLLDVGGRKVVRTLRDPNAANPVGGTALRFDPSGRLLASGSEWDKHVRLWDVASGRRVADWRVEGPPASPAFDPSGRFVAVAASPAAKLFEIGGFREHQTVAPHGHPVLGVALTPDGGTLACAAATFNNWHHADLTVWNLGEPSRPRPVSRPDGVRARDHGEVFVDTAWVAVEPARVAGAAWNKLQVFDRAGGGRTLGAPLGGAGPVQFGPGGRVWALDGKGVAVAGAGGDTLARWSNALGGKVSGLTAMRSLAVGKKWAVVGGLDGMLRLFDAQSPGRDALAPSALWEVEHRTSLQGIALAPSEEAALVTSDTGQAYLLRLPDGEVLASWKAHRDAGTAAVFLGPGVFATGGHDRAVRLWRRSGGRVEELFALRMPAAVRELAASADGRRLVVLCQGEYAARLWDLGALADQFAAYGLALEPEAAPK